MCCINNSIIASLQNYIQTNIRGYAKRKFYYAKRTNFQIKLFLVTLFYIIFVQKFKNTMLKTILLLTPVYVTLFWSVVLLTDKSNYSIPRSFLSKFMIAAFVVYLSHFFFYSGLENIYIAIDPIYQLSSLLVYPLYHIYFRLLTIDQTFSIRKHWHLLLAPFMCFILYLIGVIVADNNEYKMWLFNRNLNFTSSAMLYLKTIDQLIRVCFIIQVVYVVVSNFRLITKYGHKASHFYSNATDSSTIRITLLNYSMIFTAISSITLATLGRDFFKNEYTGIIIAAVIFSSMLFLIGWLGDRQKVLNPAFESENSHEEETQNDNSSDNQHLLIDKIETLFTEQQLFLNSKLNILDIASALGSNRTYISYLINKNFNQNFCSYVNQYRIQYLEEKMHEQPELPNQQLAELCGFGSTDSMKRAVLNKTGMSLQEWKSKRLNSITKKQLIDDSNH